jgi:DnaJ-class molecular chaperone
MDEDYYKTLGISRAATADEIQKAYREMARKHHPDLNPDDKKAKARFQAVQRAYEVLSDPKKREMYDRYGSSFDTAGAGPQPQWRHTGQPGGPDEVDFGQFFGERFGEEGAGGFADLFRQFARGAQRPTRKPARGADLEHELEIPFQTSIRGGEARINIRRSDGQSETIAVKIPAGIEDGKRIRLRGQGEYGPKGTARGDLIVRIRVAPHAWYRRSGPNLEVRVPITLQEAVDGAAIDVPTPEGTMSVKVPPGTSSGKRLRIRGHGAPQTDGTHGDLFVEVHIVIPSADQLRSEQVSAIRQLKMGPENPRSDLAW